MIRWSLITKILGTMTFLFLYTPIILLMIYSFNASRLVTVWAGFSAKWYGVLFKNEAVLSAAWISLKIAFISASLASIIGVMAGLILARFGKFRGRILFIGMVSAPLVMPEVIIGISLLLLFISLEIFIGWPSSRGVTTIIIAHTTLAVAFVAVIVEARMANFDRSIEEAATDLGARQPKIFFQITLPIISPAVIAGWFLAFVISLDDLVIASFTSGPSSTTLPILIFSKIRLGITPEINALATLLIITVSVGTLVVAYYLAYAPKRKKANHRSKGAFKRVK